MTPKLDSPFNLGFESESVEAKLFGSFEAHGIASIPTCGRLLRRSSHSGGGVAFKVCHVLRGYHIQTVFAC